MSAWRETKLEQMHCGWHSQAIAYTIGLRSVFKNCVGYLDGTIFPFECKPQIQGVEHYYSRKTCYGLNAQVVCDDDCRVRYIYCGWATSVHDNRAWQHCAIHNACGDFFSTKEYMLVDSSHKPTDIVIPAFKKGSCSHSKIPRNISIQHWSK